jgi:chromosome segregation ATPase
VTKEGVVRLMSAANYPRTKLRFDEYKRSLEDKAKAETLVNRAQSNVTRESDRVTRLRRSLESLRSQLTLLRSQPNIDIRELQFLQEQIRITSASLASAEDMEAKAQSNLDKTKSSTESAFQRADKAREDYVAALDEYEKPLAAIRTIALTHGTAL